MTKRHDVRRQRAVRPGRPLATKKDGDPLDPPSLLQQLGNRAVTRWIGEGRATGPEADNELSSQGEQVGPHPDPAPVMRQSGGYERIGERENRDRFVVLATRFRIWLHGLNPSAHQIDIAGPLFRLSKAEVTRLEKAYGQPATAGGEWNPYKLREDIARLLPTGPKIARWIETHSELTPKPTEAEAQQAQEEEVKKRAAAAWSPADRAATRRKLQSPGGWPARVQGPGGDIVLDSRFKEQIKLWGEWVVDHFDVLYGGGQITDQDVKLLAGTHGDLALIWIVRTRIWNQWVRINRDAAQPTAFVPNMLPSERKARATAAKAVLPRMESYRQLFDKTPGRLSETMKRIINDRIGQLRQAIQAGGG